MNKQSRIFGTSLIAAALAVGSLSYSALAGIEVNPDIGTSTDLNVGVDAKQDLEAGIDAGAAAETEVRNVLSTDANTGEANTDAEVNIDVEAEAEVNSSSEADIDEDTPTVDNTLMQDADARVEAEADAMTDAADTMQNDAADVTSDTQANIEAEAGMATGTAAGAAAGAEATMTSDSNIIQDLSPDVNVVESTTMTDEEKANPINWLYSPADNPGIIQDATLADGWQRGEANGIAYLTGGVGKESVAEIEPISSKYNLKVLLTTKTNNGYRALVPLWIKAYGQKQLYVVTAGPFLYVDLPPGTYDITIDNAINGQTKTVNVAANQRTDVFFSTEVDQGLEQGR